MSLIRLVSEVQSFVFSPAAAPAPIMSADEKHRRKQRRDKVTALQILKILTPHLALNVALVLYLLAGAVVFSHLERERDLEQLEKKGKRILSAYKNISIGVEGLCADIGSYEPRWKHKLYRSLAKLSQLYEREAFHIDPDDLPKPKELMNTRWTYIDSVLYALSILTTTGYTYITPQTTQGQVVSMVYGLLGIPLMVLTAVDIGRFLSDCVLFMYSQVTVCCQPVLNRLGIYRVPARRGVKDSKVRTRLVAPAGKGSRTPSTPPRKMSKKRKASAHTKTTKAGARRKLPLWVNASILLLFCMLGAVCYVSVENQLTFMDGFFATFNLVANLTMSEMPTVNRLVTLTYIVFFVTFGLAVLSMCAELAASELKWLFTKIHYFGRKMAGRRRKRKMDIEVHELLRIIELIRQKNPDKQRITSDDILQFLEEIGGIGQYYFLDRRDTIAFMPEGAFKFADEMEALELDDLTHRSSASSSNSGDMV